MPHGFLRAINLLRFGFCRELGNTSARCLVVICKALWLRDVLCPLAKFAKAFWVLDGSLCC